MSEQRPQGEFWTSPRFIIGVLLVVALVVFILANTEDVNVDFVVFDTDMALAWALLISAALGFIAGLAFAWLRGRR
ncbi:MAG TPA: LapA family protein [Dehalococcoidia bacterium]|nr:LapA family protein [Dehalococcoidia bacterium]